MKKTITSGIAVGVVAILFIAGFLAFSNRLANASIDYFQNIPNKPNNFEVIKRDFGLGEYPDICQLSEEYYLQPDFYDLFSLNFEKFYTNHDYKRLKKAGYGFAPRITGTIWKSMQKEDVVCSILMTAPGVEAWQGIKLVPSYNEYFDVKVNPSIILLPPTFPDYSVDWAKKISYTITPKKGFIPEGEYNITIKIHNPPPDVSEHFHQQVLEKPIEQNQEYLNRCYKQMKGNENNCDSWYQLRRNMYFDSGGMEMGKDMTIIIKVVA